MDNPELRARLEEKSERTMEKFDTATISEQYFKFIFDYA